MKKIFLSLLLSLTVFLVSVSGQTQRAEVLTLGTFHFNFPNLDVVKIDESDQIDVLDPRHQAEIEEIVDRLAKFKPTIIAIELSTHYQSAIDSLYNNYLAGKHDLNRGETQQIGFRLGKKLGIKNYTVLMNGAGTMLISKIYLITRRVRSLKILRTSSTIILTHLFLSDLNPFLKQNQYWMN